MNLDLHIHSRYSFDSLSDPHDIIKTAKKRGLSCIAVTDHNTIKGAIDTEKANSDGSFTVIVGAECVTVVGDIIGLFLNEELRPTRQPFEVVDQIHSQGGLAILPHPYKGHKLSDELIRRVDAVEGFNARVSSSSNAKAQELAKRFGKPVVAGSDAHFCYEIARGSMTLPSDDIRAELLRSGSNCMARRSPFILEIMSQAVRVVKEKRYLAVPKALGGVLSERAREH